MTGIVAVAFSHDARNVAGTLLQGLRHRGHVESIDSLGQATFAAIGKSVTGTNWAGGGLLVVADARIDNRLELLEHFGLERRVSNVELLAYAFRCWGHEWPAHVLGDYAVAIWDDERRELSLARDALGVRSLYWTQDEHGVRCATEPRPLARSLSRAVPSRLQMALLLSNQYDEREETLFERIESVPPAHVTVVGSSGSRSHRYWSPGCQAASPRSTANQVEEFRHAFRRAVDTRTQGIAGPELACEISGGQDSTSVAVMTSSLLESRSARAPIGVTLVFPSLACDESRYARDVAALAGLSLTQVDPFDEPGLLGWGADAPSAPDVYFHPTRSFHWLKLRRAKAEGVRVMMTGIGADQALHREQVAECADALRRVDGFEIASSLLTDGPRVVAHAMARLFLSIGQRKRFASALSTSPWLSPKWSRAVDEIAIARLENLAALPHRDETQLELTRCVVHDLPMPMACRERIGGREGVEFRHPFLDRKVIELALSLPVALASGRGREFRKPILRRAFGSMLPDSVRRRRTLTQFNPYIEKVLFECSQDPRHLLSGGRVLELGLLDEGAARRLLGSPREPRHLRPIGNWLTLELWLRSL